METLERGKIHISGRTQWDSMRFNHATQNGAQSKAYDLFVPGILHLIFTDHGRL